MRLMLIIHPDDFKAAENVLRKGLPKLGIQISEYHLNPQCPPDELPARGQIYIVDLDSVVFD